MSKKDYYIAIDVETTMKDRVADFGAIVCDRKGNILNQCAVLINGVFGIEALFYITSENDESIWSKQGKDRRFDAYNKMLENGTRVLATVTAVNRWLERVVGRYDPILTAYNLPFDTGKCFNTGIDLTMFSRRFCLWRASFNRWAFTKKYRNFVLQNHAFNPPTDLGNMSFKTNAEVMARFILNDPSLPDEPHTGLEDLIFYELPILQRLIQTTKKKDFLNPELAFDWRKVQVKDHFTAK